MELVIEILYCRGVFIPMRVRKTPWRYFK